MMLPRRALSSGFAFVRQLMKSSKPMLLQERRHAVCAARNSPAAPQRSIGDNLSDQFDIRNSISLTIQRLLRML
jgi:hypothetical protein